jgi:3-keto-5-aminohexanoate cleavage enzyme
MGQGQLDVLAAAITHGDHVRVGTEDQPYLHDGTMGATHELVREVRLLAEAAGRRVATPDEARDLIGIAPAGKVVRP